MPFNGSGVFQRVRNWVADATAGIKIRADYHDAEDDGFAAGLTNCIAKDGQTVITQNIPWNSKRITGLADPVNAQDASTKAYADTKMPLAGGTMTGPLVVNGTVTAYGYGTRKGLAGPAGANWFNFDWTGSTLDAWVDNTNLGALATRAYADSVANSASANAAAGKVNRSGDTMTGQLTTSASSQDLTYAGPTGAFQVIGNGNNATISFVVPGIFGANFGLSNGGDFYMGGWSHGNAYYKFWTTKDVASLANFVNDGRLNMAGDIAVATGPQGNMYEPWAGAVLTGWSWLIVGGVATTGSYRFRYMQLHTSSWYTVGYFG